MNRSGFFVKRFSTHQESYEVYSDADTEIEQIDLLRGKGVDGYIIMPVGVEKDHIIELMEFDKQRAAFFTEWRVAGTRRVAKIRARTIVAVFV